MIFKAISRNTAIVFMVSAILLTFAVLSIATQDSFEYHVIDIPLFFLKDIFGGSMFYSVFFGLLCHSAIISLLYLIASELKLINNASFQIVLVYLLLLNVSAASIYFSPALLSLLLIVLTIRFILQLQLQHNGNSPILSSGALVCISAMFYPPSILFVFPAFVALLILRPFSIREIIIFFIGIGLPLFYLFSVLYLGDDLQMFFSNLKWEYMLFSGLETNGFNAFSLVFYCFIALVAFLHIYSNSFKMVVRNRNFHKVWGLFLLVSIAIYFVPKLGIPVVFLFCIPFFCIAIAYFLSQLRRSWYLELAMLFVIVLSFILDMMA